VRMHACSVHLRAEAGLGAARLRGGLGAHDKVGAGARHVVPAVQAGQADLPVDEVGVVEDVSVQVVVVELLRRQHERHLRAREHPTLNLVLRCCLLKTNNHRPSPHTAPQFCTVSPRGAFELTQRALQCMAARCMMLQPRWWSQRSGALPACK